MKLSDITITNIKSFWQTYRNEIVVIVVVGVMALVFVLGIYITSPSTTTVPKADKAQAEANVLVQQAANSEANANVIHAQKVEQDKKIKVSKQKLEQTKKAYEEVRNTPVHIDNSNLDDRERKLQSDLANLYPGNR